MVPLYHHPSFQGSCGRFRSMDHLFHILTGSGTPEAPGIADDFFGVISSGKMPKTVHSACAMLENMLNSNNNGQTFSSLVFFQVCFHIGCPWHLIGPIQVISPDIVPVRNFVSGSHLLRGQSRRKAVRIVVTEVHL